MAEKVNRDDVERKKYEKLVEDYYVKKGKYDKKIRDFKKSKKFKILSLEQKKESLANFKRKMRCIKCNKAGGTIFSKEDNHLIMKCGNTKEPCNLNIDIKCATTTDAPQTLEEVKESINSLKKK